MNEKLSQDKNKNLLTVLNRELSIKKDIQHMDKFKRIIKHPYRIYLPWLIQKCGLSQRVRVKTFWGEEMEIILPEKVSTHIWKYGVFEEDVIRFLLEYLQSGMTFVDIGAHFGYFSLLGSLLVGTRGHVISFEPTPSTYKQLEKNVKKYTNIHVYPYAILDKSRQVTINDFGLMRCAWNSISAPRDKKGDLKVKKEVSVQSRKLDDLFAGVPLDVIKIDVEASEMYVLRGMQKILKEQTPILILEVGDIGEQPINSSSIVSWLMNHGYTPYEINQNNEIVEHIPKKRYTAGNLVFLKHEN
jgi:FkbM family methyltransferase